MTNTWLIRRAVRSPVEDGAHQLVGVQAAFHQELAAPLANERDALGGRLVAVRGVDDLVAADVDLVRGRRCGDFRARSDQDGNDDPELGGFDRAAQRGLVAGMHHDGLGGRDLFRLCDQPLVFRVRRWSKHADLGHCHRESPSNRRELSPRMHQARKIWQDSLSTDVSNALI
jgi:hypothetical protein